MYDKELDEEDKSLRGLGKNNTEHGVAYLFLLEHTLHSMGPYSWQVYYYNIVLFILLVILKNNQWNGNITEQY